VRGSADNSGTFKTKYNGKTYKLRYFKFALPSGEIEYLATNLASDDIFDDELAELYCMRWGIESKYNELKSFLQSKTFQANPS
jgi:IS4 transposase